MEKKSIIKTSKGKDLQLMIKGRKVVRERREGIEKY